MADALIDAGPLVALFDRRDERHEETAAVLRALSAPPKTVWPAVAEAMHILGHSSLGAQLGLLAAVEEGDVEIAPIEPGDLGRVRELMTKYGDRRMDFADAALVRVAEREGIDTIATFDVKDFRVYRAKGVGALKMLPRPGR